MAVLHAQIITKIEVDFWVLFGGSVCLAVGLISSEASLTKLIKRDIISFGILSMLVGMLDLIFGK